METRPGLAKLQQISCLSTHFVDSAVGTTIDGREGRAQGKYGSMIRLGYRGERRQHRLRREWRHSYAAAGIGTGLCRVAPAVINETPMNDYVARGYPTAAAVRQDCRAAKESQMRSIPSGFLSLIFSSYLRPSTAPTIAESTPPATSEVRPCAI